MPATPSHALLRPLNHVLLPAHVQGEELEPGPVKWALDTMM